jgi:hypothetical protein
MPQLNIEDLLKKMLEAAKGSLTKDWQKISGVATSSLKALAQNLVDIEEMKLDGTITQEKAALMIDMQKNTIKIVMLTEKGLGLLAVEAAINAVIGVVKDTVNTAIGWTLL